MSTEENDGLVERNPAAGEGEERDVVDDDDDDPPRLSAHTLAALQEFYTEQAQHMSPSSDKPVPEDWVR